MAEAPGVAPPPTLAFLAPWEVPGYMSALGWTPGPTGVSTGRAASPGQILAGRSVVWDWEVEKGSPFRGLPHPRDLALMAGTTPH